MNDGSTGRVLQGIHEFEGKGLDSPVTIGELTYTVPDGAVTQPVYLRAGNSSAELVVVSLVRDGTPMRLFPVGAKGSSHVSLRIVEDVMAGSVIEVQVAAPVGCAGTVVVDAGLVEVWS